MKLSVIVPCYNARAYIGDLLDALSREQWRGEWEVVVADNGSTDGSQDVVRRYTSALPHLRLVDALGRQGGAFATNCGVAAAEGEYVAICDADDLIAPGWVEAMGEALEQHPVVASRHDSLRLNPVHVLRGRGASQHESLQRLWYPPYVEHSGSCGLGMWRSLFHEIGGFDDTLLCAYDTDLCIRLHLAGIRIHFEPSALVHVRYRTTPEGTFHQARRWAAFNARLHRRYGTGRLEPAPAWRRYVRSWRPVVRRLRRVRTPAGRIGLAWHLGWQIGLLHGAIRYRVPPPVYAPNPLHSIADRVQEDKITVG